MARNCAHVPKPHHASLSGSAPSITTAHHQHGQVLLALVAQADLADAKQWVNRRLDVHGSFSIICRGLRQVGETFLQLGQELFDANRQRLELELFDDQGGSALPLPAVQIKDALARLAEGIGSQVVNGTEFDVNGRHGEKYTT
jgi:hypothetical protein